MAQATQPDDDRQTPVTERLARESIRETPLPAFRVWMSSVAITRETLDVLADTEEEQ